MSTIIFIYTNLKFIIFAPASSGPREKAKFWPRGGAAGRGGGGCNVITLHGAGNKKPLGWCGLGAGRDQALVNWSKDTTRVALAVLASARAKRIGAAADGSD